jgi:hypothetical protein
MKLNVAEEAERSNEVGGAEATKQPRTSAFLAHEMRKGWPGKKSTPRALRAGPCEAQDKTVWHPRQGQGLVCATIRSLCRRELLDYHKLERRRCFGF